MAPDRSTFVRTAWSLSLLFVAGCAGLVTSGCGLIANTSANSPLPSFSRPQTVDIDHTSIKWQTIGNCWAYSHLGWAESLIKKATGESLDFSETYLTYRHFEEQLLLTSDLNEIQTAGSFERTVFLLQKYGLLLEGEFIPDESGVARSLVQARAVERINESLKYGPLKTDRSPLLIRSELNKAFGISDEQFLLRTERVRLPREIAMGLRSERPWTLEDDLASWHEVVWDPDLYHVPSSLPATAAQLTRSRKSLLKTVKSALNQGHPVMINWFVDFAALDEQGEFTLATLQKNGSGHQGHHSSVMEDYVVTGNHPETGEPYETPEGNIDEKLKEWAAEKGRLRYFVIKNSWGGAERLDRPSYSRFGEKGYARLDASYLFAWIVDTSFFATPRAVITSFVLPTEPTQ